MENSWRQIEFLYEDADATDGTKFVRLHFLAENIAGEDGGVGNGYLRGLEVEPYFGVLGRGVLAVTCGGMG